MNSWCMLDSQKTSICGRRHFRALKLDPSLLPIPPIVGVSMMKRKSGSNINQSTGGRGGGGGRGRGRGRGGGGGGGCGRGRGRGRGGSRGRGSGGGGGDNLDPDREDGSGRSLLRRRSLLPEIFESKTLDSVLIEWGVSRRILPFYLQAARVTGNLSSSQLTRYLSFHKGPNFIMCLIRSFGRGFHGRALADPYFKIKLIFQFVASASSSLWLESRSPRKKLEESDSIMKSALAAAATQSFVVWLMASCCDYSPVGRQGSIPNNVFEANYEFKKFGVAQRILCLIRSGVNLFLLGTLVKAAEVVGNGEGINGGTLTLLRNGMHFGLDCNLRYQILGGLDRLVVGYFDDISVAMALCSIFRASNAWIGANKGLENLIIFMHARPRPSR